MNIGGSVNDEIVIDKMCAMVNVRFKIKVLTEKSKTLNIKRKLCEMTQCTMTVLHYFITSSSRIILTMSYYTKYLHYRTCTFVLFLPIVFIACI